jgi:hypothetical protein
MSNKDKVVIKKDGNANELFVEGNSIYLSMKGNTERLGTFDLHKKQIIMHKEYFDLNQRFQAYGFNAAMIEAATKCDTIFLICPEGKFLLPIKEILDYGTPLIYGTRDLSSQLYLDLYSIKKYPIN